MVGLDLAFAIGIIFAALLAFYMAWVFGRKCCWNCQRSVERFERGCVGERTASAQRLLLVAWILGSIAAFAALTAAAQGPLHRTAVCRPPFVVAEEASSRRKRAHRLAVLGEVGPS